MANTNTSLHQDTGSLISSCNPHPFYRTDIQTSHWQLRSLVSSSAQDLIYYPSGTDVYVLDTRAEERRLVSKIPFTPVCLTTAGGWLCCGGHNGKFSAVKLPPPPRPPKLDPEPRPASFDLGPNSSLPLSLSDDLRPIRSPPPILDYAPASDRPLLANLKFVGEEPEDGGDAINNCISLWCPKRWSSERTYQIPVAVLANNDKSVYIMNLRESEQIDRLTYPDCVNRAVMSPDGEILAAVLDDPFLYVHKRKRREELTPGLFSAKEHFEWSPLCRIQLKGQSLADQSRMKGSFALSFSESGKYLAVATQHGVISVFEVEAIADETTIPIAVLTSTRPGTSSGAVRSLSFCPGPFDLLAWAEAKGRVCIADIRSGFISRQMLVVDSRSSHYETIHTTERSGDPIIDPRLRSSRTDSPTSSDLSTPDHLGLDPDQQQDTQLTLEMMGRNQAPLTIEELEVLQAHQIARRARDAQANAPNASLWNPPPAAQRSHPTISVEARDFRAGGSTRIGSSLTDAQRTSGLSGLFRDYSSSASIRNFITERNLGRDRRAIDAARRSQVLQYEPDPRHFTESARTSSIQYILRQRHANTVSTPASNIRRPRNEPAGTIDRLTLRTSGTDAPSNPWDEIDALYRARQANSTASIPLRNEDEDEDRATITRIRNREETLIVERMFRARYNDQEGPAIMGISWSPDGRKLYVGADDGIYEFHVNTASRRQFPSLVMR
ncbi:WD40-repeat-containing domain protein [Calycina marina]|uniref:WD40-repeat-containing domain protein n=1 Tax=Calycina marina TaxID=1763456 RepID=A0A9P7ZD77_9HELO|nr:WD40-repeat-containing domain protein [Calycina marina]